MTDGGGGASTMTVATVTAAGAASAFAAAVSAEAGAGAGIVVAAVVVGGGRDNFVDVDGVWPAATMPPLLLLLLRFQHRPDTSPACQLCRTVE